MAAEFAGAAGREPGAGRCRVQNLDRYACSFRADPGVVRDVLRAAVARFARRLSAEEAGTLELALAEVLNNVVEHGYAGLPPGPVEIDITHDSDALWCQVSDEGHPMPDLKPPEGRLQPVTGMIDDLAEGGWGWALIRTLTADLNYARIDGRNELSFRLALGEA
ncbi:Serine/threonine-protein kinase BtrW [Defluviimonas aquaemixtae]|uniref:Serine/threonine-protein kinase BtrW n=1 Tax=Albidovulum aquaemixtae TaxID=1542388 RepID=A0A2R8BL40_9RHOB|nr:ATP-binding protein [Defluviimonas aquaemixtae]SPH24137.1 Serine/threonine-protein kinase BtrW [Defluviimonas aquaemixtae]